MNKIFLFLGAAAMIGCIWLGYSLASKNAELRASRLEQVELRREKDALLDAIQALSVSNERANSRADRALEAITEYRREPVTETCGPVVHGAVDRLRQH